MHKLAFVGVVTNCEPVANSDHLDSVTVDCINGGQWQGVTKRSDFQIGNRCEVYLVDAVLPNEPRFGFLWKRRIKVSRLRGAPSECLIMPVSEATEHLSVGTDIAQIIGVTKYEKEIRGTLRGEGAGSFPSRIPKTDEPNFQTVWPMVRALVGNEYYSTVKVDGSSGTVFVDEEGQIRACSRNLELRDNPTTAAWQIIRKYGLNHLASFDTKLALQFEMVGPGIQKNRLGLSSLEMRVFNAFDVERGTYYGFDKMVAIIKQLDLPMVDVIDAHKVFDLDDAERLRQYADRKYPNWQPAEGVVIRPVEETSVDGQRLSFKVLNDKYRG